MKGQLKNSFHLNNHTFENLTSCKFFLSAAVAFITILFCILPMDNLPIWNGEIPRQRNQYELMAESILEGRIDFPYNDDQELSKLENPYDPDAREEAGVTYHWDHAYYKGHYYMYFGIVPVFLTFLPYRILTGSPLTTYHATQIFTAMTIVGIFMLFHLLAKLFFKKLPYAAYLALSVAFSVMAVWYSSAEPALYCTAITSAIALQIFSIYFFIRAVWYEKTENRQILFAGIGSLFGALVFGCRPPIAFANLLVLPMLIVFLRQRKFTWKLLGKLILAALPYVIVGIALMLYNYVRFENPFEFGQAYQLTEADQSQYSFSLQWPVIQKILAQTPVNFFARGEISRAFPYIKAGGVFFNFPILLLSALICKRSVFQGMKQEKVLSLTFSFFLTIFIISALDIMWAPYLLERYHMDIYFLMGIVCFLILGFWYQTSTKKGRPWILLILYGASFMTTLFSYLLYLQTVARRYPENVQAIGEMLHLL